MSRIIALLQANLVVGDINGNAAKISQLVEVASKAGAQMALSTELAISGYPPRDLLLQADFIQNCAEVATHLDTAIPTLIAEDPSLCAVTLTLTLPSLTSALEVITGTVSDLSSPESVMNASAELSELVP